MEPAVDIVVRPACSADAPSLDTILRDTFESTWRPNITPAAARAYLGEDRPGTFVRERGLRSWVAECAGNVVGLVDWEGDFVNALHVLGRYSRKGVGAALMDRAEAEILRASFPVARLETDTFNTSSQSFYKARGYLETGRYPDVEWSSGLTTVLLTKILD